MMYCKVKSCFLLFYLLPYLNMNSALNSSDVVHESLLSSDSLINSSSSASLPTEHAFTKVLITHTFCTFVIFNCTTAKQQSFKDKITSGCVTPCSSSIRSFGPLILGRFSLRNMPLFPSSITEEPQYITKWKTSWLLKLLLFNDTRVII